MAEITVIVLDNTYSSQNQDYLPSRFLLQKEIADAIITKTLETDSESLIGVIPIAQKAANSLLTPTKTRKYLTAFLHDVDLAPDSSIYSPMYQADLSLHVTELSNKNLVIFLSSRIANADELLSNLYTIASKGIVIRLVCFGEALALGSILAKEIEFDNFGCLCIKPEEDFSEKVLTFLGAGMSTYDPELEEAIRRSLQQ